MHTASFFVRLFVFSLVLFLVASGCERERGRSPSQLELVLPAGRQGFVVAHRNPFRARSGALTQDTFRVSVPVDGPVNLDFSPEPLAASARFFTAEGSRPTAPVTLLDTQDGCAVWFVGAAPAVTPALQRELDLLCGRREEGVGAQSAR